MTGPAASAWRPWPRSWLEHAAEDALVRPQLCPTCGSPSDLVLDKGARFQFWHPARLFPCAVRVG